MYHLFISHSWNYGYQYDGLCCLLNACENFKWKDYSVPKDDPIQNARTDKELKDAIRKQMAPTSVVLILAGVYSTYSKWINIEIELAKEMNKPIIAVEYWGSEKTSTEVKNVAKKTVKWNTSSIIDAIKEIAND